MIGKRYKFWGGSEKQSALPSWGDVGRCCNLFLWSTVQYLSTVPISHVSWHNIRVTQLIVFSIYMHSEIPGGMEWALTDSSTSVHVLPSPPHTAQLSKRLSDSIRPSQPIGCTNKTRVSRPTSSLTITNRRRLLAIWCPHNHQMLQRVRPPNAFLCNSQPKICKSVKSFTHVHKTPIQRK